MGGQESDRRISYISLEWMLGRAESKELKLRPGWRELLQTDPTGKLQPPNKLIWWFRAADRTVLDEAKVHISVIRRMEDPRNRYCPGNLPESYAEVS